MDDCHSASGVHLISWKCVLGWVEMKILDSLGMKYTHLIFGLLALLAAFACTAPAFAQAQAYASTAATLSDYSAVNADDPQAGAMLTIHKRVDEVNVLFIATDKHGKFVRDLNQNDFSILDDHKPPQSILNFRRETDLPLHLGLLIDVSGSVHGRFTFEQDAAISFLQHTIRAKFDKAFVVGFNKQSQMGQDFTDNVQLLSNGIHRMQNGGGTALYDAIYKASKEKFLKDRPERPARKAIIVVSDGEDNQSDVSRAQAIEMAQRAEVIIYAISTDDSGLILRGDKVLEQLAAATGGRAFFPFKMKDMTRSFAAIEDELRSQYVVSYKPADFDADGRYRSIEISSLKKDLQVRARKGYFAPQQ
ncbi:MAG: Ca-activated chloride channel [Acidobacteriaceae bacterium]|jgi:Ca-activated chloride channel family protein|nr:Ca-activated chloride channel [Acidobacteriaceae bacterium]